MTSLLYTINILHHICIYLIYHIHIYYIYLYYSVVYPYTHIPYIFTIIWTVSSLLFVRIIYLEKSQQTKYNDKNKTTKNKNKTAILSQVRLVQATDRCNNSCSSFVIIIPLRKRYNKIKQFVTINRDAIKAGDRGHARHR